MATVACKCGEKFHPSPEHYGKEVKCRRCGRMVKLTPDASFEAPPKPQTGNFTQTFGHSAPPPPQYTPYTPPPPAAEPEPDAPRPGLHPEIRKILIYAAVILGVVSLALIFTTFHSAPTQVGPPPPPDF
jgi:hypothetical protein